MVEFLNFVPVEYRGMSILTLIVFSFIIISAGFWWNTIKREFKRINLRLSNHDIIINTEETAITILKQDINRIDTVIEHHDNKLDEGNRDISEMKINIALTLQAVKNIEKMLEKYSRDN